MNYWNGYMDWPLVAGWKCQTCNAKGSLIWGMVHAVCRCDNCHTQYYMRDDTPENKCIDTPICLLKPEYQDRAKRLYEKLHTPLSKWTDEVWDSITPADSDTYGK